MTKFEETYALFLNEHKQDAAEDATLQSEIESLLEKGGVKKDILDAVLAMIMKKVQNHCAEMVRKATS